MVLAVLGLLTSTLTADTVASVGRVRSGVAAGSLELGGRSEEEARALLIERADRLGSVPVEFFGERDKVTLKPSDVGFEADVETTLGDAMGVGRRGNFFVALWHRLRSHLASTDVGWSTSVDDEKVSAVVKGWAERFDDAGHEAGIRARGSRVVPVDPLPGRALDRGRARRALVAGLESWPRRSIELPYRVEGRRTDAEDAQAAAKEANEWLRRPMTLRTPDDSTVELEARELAPLLEAVPRERGVGGWSLEVRFSPDKVEERFAADMTRYEREPKDARFTVGGGGVNIQPSEDGRAFDAEATAEAMSEAARGGDDEAKVAFSSKEPDLTTEDARALRIKEVVSSYTTNHPCCQPRVRNIHRMADIVDGTVVRPGATFSLNQRVGRRTTDRGFVLAPMIFDGEYKDDVGGGVSQFATTFFNAVFFGGYDIVSHQAHSYYISRYPPGREATVSWPAPDLTFRNDSNSGILIKTSYSGSSIGVTFYGDKEGKVVRSSSGERRNFTDPPEQRKANPALAPGQERVVQSGSRGFTITVKRTITQNGKTRTESYTTRYKPEPRIIEVGPPGTPRPASPQPSPDGGGDTSTPPPAKETPKPPQTPKPPGSS